MVACWPIRFRDTNPLRSQGVNSKSEILVILNPVFKMFQDTCTLFILKRVASRFVLEKKLMARFRKAKILGLLFTHGELQQVYFLRFRSMSEHRRSL